MRLALALAALALASAAGVAQTNAPTPVPVSHFDSFELEGGGHVTMKYGPAQVVRLLKGSTSYTNIHPDADDHSKLVIETCNADCPHNYELEVEIVTPDIAGVAISGGGHIESAGAFHGLHKIAAAVHGGGKIDIRSLDVSEVTAAVNGGGGVLLKAKDTLVAAVNGGGHIEYWGNPQVTEAVNGGGSVSKGN
ncbi:MAG: DUF2807 domain-containing protein [Rhizomicrobium sp.]|jgi:hypothetical protein